MELLFIDKPNYLALIKKYLHLKGVNVNDNDTKASLPVHLVLDSGEYARIKTEIKPRIGQENDPITELTKFGWFLMSPRKEFGKISCFWPKQVKLILKSSQLSCMCLGDESTYGVGEVIYSVERQEDGITQTVVTAKPILAKRTLTVPSLELVSAHIAWTNLVIKVKNALKDLPVPTMQSTVGWTASLPFTGLLEMGSTGSL